ncbi:hypothetical protein QTJ16_001040 [Diplocarpon rosae]|uniref:GRF-type domain-containing protein n=1 Tax=Diplocarpon rosae TaxID=946125 RepID=A0AAD9T6F5_9HELO|nr:hypothetical protein QTJ16_001040 [Diplocarpon rosae]
MRPIKRRRISPAEMITTQTQTTQAGKEKITPRSSPKISPHRSPQCKPETHSAHIKGSKGWCGTYELGKWFCKCCKPRRQANCITVKKPGPYQGQKFWRCPADWGEQCDFFVWVHEDAIARAWLRKVKREISPTTPTKQGLNPDELESSGTDSNHKPTIMDKWTSGSKRPFEAEEDKHGGEREEEAEEGQSGFDTWATSSQNNARASVPPARKSKKGSRFDTPRQLFTEKLAACKTSLPTPDTSRRGGGETSEARRLQAMRASPTPVQLDAAINLGSRAEPQPEPEPAHYDLCTLVLELIAEDSKLKRSTKLLIRHEIEQESRRHQAEVRGYQKTIERLKEAVDNLEAALGNQFSDDDAVVLSD